MAEFVADWMGINGNKQQQQQRPLPRTGAPLWALLDWIHLGAELHLEGRVSMATCGWRAVSCKIGGCRWRLCSHSRIAGQDGHDARHQKAAICCRRAFCTGPVVLMTQLDDCSTTLFVTPGTRVDGDGWPWMMMMAAMVLMSGGRVNPSTPFHTRLAWISITTLVARPSGFTPSDTAVSLARESNLLAIYCDTATLAPAHQISHGRASKLSAHRHSAKQPQR
ncbi:hypothetical protein COCVIDRAFT_41634 [Bipolaris victoriae FI3]|uniref:Uncharacterized protein n=1 Tax=Bipolaris victoriae (strain FI3) TaxID=930091 RepID=W7E679_BIPV3|nr:hypothetical protein COCVIDRAFT_41634 [Bipolaris victoriae FI3]